jgi:hypothetical protein
MPDPDMLNVIADFDVIRVNPTTAIDPKSMRYCPKLLARRARLSRRRTRAHARGEFEMRSKRFMQPPSTRRPGKRLWIALEEIHRRSRVP